MSQKQELGEVWLQLSPDLLIHSDWERVPPPASSWVDQRLSGIRGWLEAEPWRDWDQTEWINALVFVGVGLAVLGNVATFIAEVRRASAVR